LQEGEEFLFERRALLPILHLSHHPKITKIGENYET
jgi:hypothetical protein